MNDCDFEFNVDTKVYTVDDFFPDYVKIDVNKPICYIIMCADECAFEGGGTIDKIFMNPEVAIKYCNRKNELEKESGYYFYPEAQNYSDEDVDLITPIVECYGYTCSQDCEDPEEEWVNDPEEKYIKMFDGDIFVDMDDLTYTVYSKNSFEEAKQKALDIWEKGCKLENGYYDGFGKVCPICGGRIKHPYTGAVTTEQIEEDSNCCIWVECIDEGRSTIGYHPCCRKENK